MSINNKEKIKSQREIWMRQFFYSMQRKNEGADNFTRLEIQIAAIFLALSGSLFSSTVAQSIVLIKILFFAGLLLLLFSLSIGLIHIDHKNRFWERNTDIYFRGFRKWDDLYIDDGKLQEGKTYCNSLQENEKESSPKWTWVLQTALLVVGLLLLITSFGIILF